MRKVLLVLGGLALSTGLLGMTSVSSSSVAAAGPVTGAVTVAATGASTVVSPDSPITHVVIIYQENHSFDDVLGAYCQTRANPCDGYAGPVTFADGITAEGSVQPDIVPVVSHEPKDQTSALRNEWDTIGGCTTTPYWCVSHVDPNNMQNLSALADAFTVSDRTFAAGKASSFGAHVTLGAGTLDGFRGTNPVDSKTGARPRFGWGCSSRKDAIWGPKGQRSYEPTCIPDQEGKGAYRKTRVPYSATVMERMEQAGLSWHTYEGDSETEPHLGTWSICTYFAWCWGNRWDLEHNSSKTDFQNAALAGTLPNLSILIPAGGVSQHNFASMTLGDNYLGDVVGAAMNGPDWDSTAIFITYDDCGCFYDHVMPPKGLGLRNPMVIISPYAKPAGTDSTPATQPFSMLAFTEHAFGLQPLSTEVTEAYDYAKSFDFTQKPLSGPTMTDTPISAREQARLARLLPRIEEDPT